jgi:hypothetical protein
MQRTYKIFLRGFSVVFFSMVMLCGAVVDLAHKDKDEGRGKSPSTRIFAAFTPPKALADAPPGDGAPDCGVTCACGDSCDGGSDSDGGSL